LRKKKCPLFPLIRKGFTLVGDNSYVKTEYMSFPFKGGKTEIEDSYNFYQSQLRISIEQSFGVLVHRWAILCGPPVVSIAKVSNLVSCLCKLHNFCINERLAQCQSHEIVSPITEVDARHIHQMVVP
jgi:hypothetical protein